MDPGHTIDLPGDGDAPKKPPPAECTEEVSQDKGSPDREESSSQSPPQEGLLFIHPTPPAVMDVHHHAHAPHGTKPWKEYLFQFFMLFLAVFCGFLAEYQLEHTIEHQREKRYMKGLLENLAADTVMINESIGYAQFLVRGLDSLQQNLYSEGVLQNAPVVYRQYATYIRNVTQRFNDQGIIQLRNSGNMRLVGNKEITDLISKYWAQMNVVTSIAERTSERVDFAQEAAYRIFNRKYITQPVSTGDPTRNAFTVAPGASFMTGSKMDLVAYANSLNRLSGTIGVFYVSNMQHQKRLGKELMALIREEYHFR